jgi:VIT1/CCC1 family predicted Fe2+/Mn2+ transporter
LPAPRWPRWRSWPASTLGIDPRQLARPGHAAWAFLSFIAGAVLPLLAITLVPGPHRRHGHRGPRRPDGGRRGQAAIGRAPRLRAIARNVLGGAIAMGVTYGIGSAIGAADL